MKRLTPILMVLIPALALAGGISRPLPAGEATLWMAWRNTTLTAAAQLGGHILPADRGWQAGAVTFYLNVVSGGGAGNTVITITDGTNTCLATVPCSLTASGVTAKRVSVSNGLGTGCSYAPGAVLTASVTTAGCTTTQPSVLNVDFLGNWR